MCGVRDKPLEVPRGISYNLVAPAITLPPDNVRVHLALREISDTVIIADVREDPFPNEGGEGMDLSGCMGLSGFRCH